MFSCTLNSIMVQRKFFDMVSKLRKIIEKNGCLKKIAQGAGLWIKLRSLSLYFISVVQLKINILAFK